ncbi:MAG: hypothetical protein ACXWT4_09140, partial [Methylobacter sp.]
PLGRDYRGQGAAPTMLKNLWTTTYMDVLSAATLMMNHILVLWIPAVHAGMTAIELCYFS